MTDRKIQFVVTYFTSQPPLTDIVLNSLSILLIMLLIHGNHYQMAPSQPAAGYLNKLPLYSNKALIN